MIDEIKTTWSFQNSRSCLSQHSNLEPLLIKPNIQMQVLRSVLVHYFIPTPRPLYIVPLERSEFAVIRYVSFLKCLLCLFAGLIANLLKLAHGPVRASLPNNANPVHAQFLAVSIAVYKEENER